MATAFVTDVMIDRGPDLVWRVLTDWSNAPAWMSGISSVTPSGPTAPGMELIFASRGKERPALIASVDPGRSVVVRSVQGGVTADYVYELHDGPDGTTMARLTALCRTRGMWIILSPVLRRAMKRADAHQLIGLKEHIGG